MKKILTLSLMLMFLLMTVSSANEVYLEKQTNYPMPMGVTLYVGGSGPNNYTKIQDAVDNAVDGDTVFVYNGKYYENVVINKTINLTGEDRNKTIIDGGGNVNVVYIEYDTDWVNISGFTIRCSGNNPSDAGIYVITNFNTISDNTIYNNSLGIYLDGINNTISKNVIKYNRYIGISIESSDNLITNNNILNNDIGIWIFHDNNNISFNNISKNGRGISGWNIFNNFIFANIISSNNLEGIDLENAYNTTISYNIIFSNLGSGIDFETCRRNNVTDNIITNNEYGLNFWYGNTNNIIINNSIISNDIIGIKLDWGDHCNISNNTVLKNGNGIQLYDMRNCIINENFISANNGYGIYIEESNSNNITNNTITKNNGDGINIQGFSYNNITGNTISSNNGKGIYLSSGSTNNLIYNNYFDNINNAIDDGINNIWAVPITSGTNICGGTNKGGNYWSDYKPYFGIHPPYPPFNEVKAWHPDYPIPGSAGSVDEYPIPGFELIAVMGALAIAIILFKRKK